MTMSKRTIVRVREGAAAATTIRRALSAEMRERQWREKPGRVLR